MNKRPFVGRDSADLMGLRFSGSGNGSEIRLDVEANSFWGDR